jgi:cytidylate kinase
MFLNYNNKIFTKTLKYFREIQNTKQKQLKNSSNIENGRKKIKADDVKKYIDLYNINVNDFLEVYNIFLKYDTNNSREQ